MLQTETLNPFLIRRQVTIRPRCLRAHPRPISVCGAHPIKRSSRANFAGTIRRYLNHVDKRYLTDDKFMNRGTNHSGTSLRLFEPDPAVVYPIETVERLAQLPRRKILIYCRHRLVSPVADPELSGFYFSGDAIRALRWIGYLQATRGVNLAGIKLILELVDELQRLRATSADLPVPTQSSKSKEKK